MVNRRSFLRLTSLSLFSGIVSKLWLGPTKDSSIPGFVQGGVIPAGFPDGLAIKVESPGAVVPPGIITLPGKWTRQEIGEMQGYWARVMIIPGDSLSQMQYWDGVRWLDIDTRTE